VAGSSFITLLASLFANSIVPSSLAIGPSALLPSHDHTIFQVCPAAITPGIAFDGGGAGGSGGGPALAAASPPPPMRNCVGAVLHLAITAARPGSCQDCRLWPRSNADEGFWALAVAPAHASTTASAIVVFMIVPPRVEPERMLEALSRPHARNKTGGSSCSRPRLCRA
jgi:hypothetical protein